MPDNNPSLEEWLEKRGPGYSQEILEYYEKSKALVDHAEALETALNTVQAEGIAADGLVKVTMNARSFPVNVEIAPESMTSTAAELSALVLAAMNEAHDKSREQAKLIMQSYLKKHGFLLQAYLLDEPTIPIKPITPDSFNFYDFDA